MSSKSRFTAQLITQAPIHEPSRDYITHHPSLNKPSFSERTINGNVSQQVINLIIKEIPATETSLNNNSVDNGRLPNNINENLLSSAPEESLSLIYRIEVIFWATLMKKLKR